MSLVSNSALVRGSISWEQSATNTGFNDTTQKGDISVSLTPSTTTYNEVFLARYSMAASGTQTVDLYSITTLLNQAKTITKLIGLIIKATASVTGGVLKIENGGSNPLLWPLASGDAMSVTVGTAGAVVLIAQGTTHTVSNTAKTLLLTNTGTQTITVLVGALVGT